MRSHTRSFALLATALIAATALAGCAVEAPIEEVLYIATDYGFEGPDSFQSGLVQMHIDNRGAEVHHIQLMRLDDGHTPDELLTALEGGELPSWAKASGGPGAAMPGAVAAALMDLEPGTYVLLCFVPDANGVPHLAHGMTKVVEVEQRLGGNWDPPKADVVLDLHEFKFKASDPILAGERTFRVVNEGTQYHEAILMRFHGNATTQDVMAAFGPNATGPPPADFIGGVAGIEPGMTAWFATELTPGRYGWVCFLDDVGGNGPHVVLGMSEEFEVT